MRIVEPHRLWLGHRGDTMNWSGIFEWDIQALVDLSGDEPPVVPPRGLMYCRFPLTDGSGNPPWLLRAAVRTTARLIAERVPTLIFCSAGMSRTPAVAAAALAIASGQSFDANLILVTKAGARDVSLTLAADLRMILDQDSSAGASGPTTG